ncbi:MAG: oligosaccharide flippase family protein [Euryarchaeota archaeon]|nr:oligosaccharide flippase family protein [Euryarchaeota archaeon]
MADNLKEYLSAYQKILNLLSTHFVRNVLRGLSVLGGGYAVAKVISLAEELFIGRYLGVQTYGTYLVILAISTIFSAVMALGIPKAVVKIVAEKNERIADVPVNAFFIAFFLSVAISLPVIIIGSSGWLLSLLGITLYQLVFGYVIAFLLTVYTVAQSFKLALYNMRYVIIADIVYWGVALAFFVLFRNLTLGLVGICVGSVVGSAVLIRKVPLTLSRFSLSTVRGLLPLSVYLGADTVIGLSAQQISILYLNIIASAYFVGVFGAHARSSIFLIVPLVTVVTMALYPRFCSIDKASRPQVGRYLAFLGVPVVVSVLLLSYVSGIVFLYIFRVQVIQSLLLLLAVYSALFFYNRVWDKLVTACEGAKIVAWGVVLGTITFLLIMVMFTPLLGGMQAIAAGMISNELIYGIVLLSWFKRHASGNQGPKTISDSDIAIL